MAEVISPAELRDRAVGLAVARGSADISDAERRLYLEPTVLIPTDGIVKDTSDRITGGAGERCRQGARHLRMGRREHLPRCRRHAAAASGDIAAHAESGNLGGKCADLNALFVGLARAAGIPARDVYGLRVAPSQFGYKSLGANSRRPSPRRSIAAPRSISHGFGWVPVDPADVRKVVLEEPPGNLAIDDAKVVAARKALLRRLGRNWIAYNFAHDVALPGSTGPELGFLMYPQAERCRCPAGLPRSGWLRLQHQGRRDRRLR